jgi:hypothetical protein
MTAVAGKVIAKSKLTKHKAKEKVWQLALASRSPQQYVTYSSCHILARK